MEIRPAVLKDLDAIMEVYACAKRFMQENNNSKQWQGTYPEREIITEDIKNNNVYVCLEDLKIVCVFALIIAPDSTYTYIEDGQWSCDKEYGAIHRVASNGTVKGVAEACFNFCKSKIGYLRVDTHVDNIPMQSAILKNGFKRCGIVYMNDGSKRIAYDFS